MEISQTIAVNIGKDKYSLIILYFKLYKKKNLKLNKLQKLNTFKTNKLSEDYLYFNRSLQIFI